LYNISTCRDVVDLLYSFRFVVYLSWTCRGLVVQLVVQQVHNKSNKWSLKTSSVARRPFDWWNSKLRVWGSSVMASAASWKPNHYRRSLQCGFRKFRCCYSLWW